MSVDTKSWVEKDKKYIWHAMSRYDPKASPLVVTEAEGAWITDIDGNQYLDGMSGLWCVNVGYGRKELAQAAYEQLNAMPYYPLTQSHVPAIQLGEKLNEWLGGEYIVFFSNSGSEANETAFKIARQYHQQRGEGSRYKFLSRYRAYHGNSMGALSATGQAERKYRYEPLTPGFIHVPPPDTYRRPQGMDMEAYGRESARAVDQTIMWEMRETVAGVIMEPVITGGGVIVPPDNYLREVQDICNKHGALFIIDEVICGFGRTGKPFGFMNYGVQPDIVTMAKGITSAYLPLSATAVRRDLYEAAFAGTDEYNRFRHVNTFGGNPAACALAVKNLEIMQNEKLVDRSRDLGDKLREEWTELEAQPASGTFGTKGCSSALSWWRTRKRKHPLSRTK